MKFKYSSLKQKIAILLIIVVLYFFLKDFTTYNGFVVFSFLYIIYITFREVFNPKAFSFGLSQIFYLFSLVFLGLAPLFQYLNEITLWGGKPFTDNDFIIVNLLLILSFHLYGYVYQKRIRRKNCKSLRLMDFMNKDIYVWRLCIVSLLASGYIFLAFGGNIMALLLRSDYMEADVVSEGGLSYLINSFFLRPIPAICFLMFKFFKKKNIYAEIFLLFLMLLTNAPTGMPRFAVAAFYIPVAFLYFPFIRSKLNFPFLIILAIVVVFPLLNLFRFQGTELALNMSMFLEGHFDSYQMLARVVAENFITYGYQLLGVIFFFVPRAIWPTKPIGSGYLIAHECGYYFDNISMNFLGEGYINFGMIGMLLFAYLMAYVNSSFDYKYWNSNGSKLPLFSLLFFIYIGMEFVIMRGTLLSMFPVLIGYTVMTFILYYLVKKRKRKKRKE